jgi:hypothetical protein
MWRLRQAGIRLRCGGHHLFLLGELDAGFEWANKAILQHEPYALWIGVNFSFNAMRSDPRYPDLPGKLKLSA